VRHILLEDSAVQHTFVFLGTTESNPDIQASARYFINTRGSRSAVRRPKHPGIVFGFMEGPKGPEISHVDELRLQTPVVIQRKRHLEGGGLSPHGRNIGIRAAERSLSDAIEANPRLALRLRAKLARLHS
jgi:hypothetical protein